jgi:hypothetical protein
VDSTSESSQKNGGSSTEQVSVALPQQLSKAMVSLLASLSARDLSTGLSSQRESLLLSSSMLVSHSYASSDRSVSTVVHAADQPNGLFSAGREDNLLSGMSPSMDLLARSVRQRRRPIEMK